MKILYHCSDGEGGLAEYSWHQAEALAALNYAQIIWHAPSSLSVPPGVCCLSTPLVRPRRVAGRTKLHRATDFVVDTFASYKRLSWEIERHHVDAVMLSSWSEYLSPFWAPKLRFLRDSGIRFGAIIHDPVRDFIRGPDWWHQYSVRQAYSFIDVAFTHDDTAIDTCGSRASFKTVVVPHGAYPMKTGRADKATLRREFGIPEDADVMLAFGHIRDGKNLDQIIAALPFLPKAHLLVVGREQSGGQRPASAYRDMALTLGVEERCHWFIDYIPKDEVWKFFQVSNLLMLSYSKDFYSASGVLNVNAQFGLPVLASAGGGPLLDAVKKYNLGVIISCANASSISEAVPLALASRGDWIRFSMDHSWKENAKRVLEALLV